MVVLLDFDGVTQGVHSKPFDPQCLAELDAVLTEHAAQVMIIISWRGEMPAWRLVEKLDRVGTRVTGVAPEEPVSTGVPRELVVTQWLDESGYVGPWLAIDDNPA